MPVYDDYKFGNPWGVGLVMNMAITDATANLSALTSGTLCLVAGITVPANRTITNVAFMSATTPAAALTHWWFTIADAGTLKTYRSTADQVSAGWAANTAKSIALSSTWTPTVDTAVYVGVMVVGTVPTLAGSALVNAAVASSFAPVKFCGNSNTGATTPLADNTTLTAITAGASAPLCALL
jgi:hypothetical protein